MAYSEKREGSHAAASTSTGASGTLLPRLPGHQPQLGAAGAGASPAAAALAGGHRKAGSGPAVGTAAADASRLFGAARAGAAGAAAPASGGSGASAVAAGPVAAAGPAAAARGGAAAGKASPGGGTGTGTGTGTARASSGSGSGSAAGRAGPAHASTAVDTQPCHPHQPQHPYFTGGPGGDPAATQTTHAIQQQALRQQVQKDIKKLLSCNRAYTQHVKGARAPSPQSLTQLAKPKPKPGSRPDQMVDLPDPVDWAVWKTEQLAIARLTEERRRGEVAAEKAAAEAALAEFRTRRAEETAALVEEVARKRAEEEAFARHMSTYLNHKGAVELDEFKRRKEEERERLALARGRAAKASGFGPHH